VSSRSRGAIGLVPGVLCCALACGWTQGSVVPPGGVPQAHPRRVASAIFAAYAASSRRVGSGARFRPPARGARADRGMVIDGMSCRRRQPLASEAHVELYAASHVVAVPAGIGVAPSVERRSASAARGRCLYPLHTVDPTGLVLLAPGRRYTLGELFDVWGAPVSSFAVAGFRARRHGRVSVFIDGRRWRGGPASAPLAPWSQVTIEIGPYVAPHSSYLFPALSAVSR
jgi:hypothetical protein